MKSSDQQSYSSFLWMKELFMRFHISITTFQQIQKFDTICAQLFMIKALHLTDFLDKWPGYGFHSNVKFLIGPFPENY